MVIFFTSACLLFAMLSVIRFLIKLLTEDLPRLFVRPKKIVLDFQKGEAVGPVPDLFKSADVQEKNKDSVGELSVTLIDARNLSYAVYGISLSFASIDSLLPFFSVEHSNGS